MEMGWRLFLYRSHFHTLVVAFGQFPNLSMRICVTRARVMPAVVRYKTSERARTEQIAGPSRGDRIEN